MRLLGIILPIAFPLVIYGIWVLVTWRTQHGVPRSWRQVGSPPPGVEQALQVLRDLCPGMPWGGTIEWVAGPVGSAPAAGIAIEGGSILDLRKHRLRLQRASRVWETALARAIHHLWLHATSGEREAPEDESFRRWVNDANSAIASSVEAHRAP